MTDRRTRKTLLTSAAAAALAGGYAQAQEASDLEARVARLESLLEQVLERMEQTHAPLSPMDQAIVDAAEQAVARASNPSSQTAQSQVAPPASPDEGASTQPPAERLPGFRVGNTDVSYGGFIKLDTMVTRFSDGAPSQDSLIRDFYIPGLLPVGNEDADAETVIDFNPRETRMFFTTETPVRGHKVSSRVELDFQVLSGGDERVSNSFQLRIRQAYLDFDDWRFGMDWSTFQDVRALPEALDFIGPTEGTVFNRQPMIRWTGRPGPGKLELAVEQPETTITNRTGGRVLPGADIFPDFVARYTMEGDWGHVSLAGLGRQLRVNAGDATFTDIDGLTRAVGDETALAGGGSFSGKINLFTRDDLRFMANYGTGLGRYVGVNEINGAAITLDGELETIPLYSGFLAYRRFWTPKWRSNASLSYFKGDNPVELTTGAVTDQSLSFHGNLLFSPIPNVTFGLEYIYAMRELEDGRDGTMNRMQFSAKYGL